MFSHTSDEPVHVACGMEWLDKGTYQIETQHPPLARVAAALGPYLAGCRLYGPADASSSRVYSPGSAPGAPGMWATGLNILVRDGQYDRNLMLARLGILPFFWLASLVVYLWARIYIGKACAVFSALAFTFLPPILGHAGLATTDMPLTATLSAAFLTTLIWLNRPTVGNSVIWGFTVGLAVLSKFSALPYLPVALASALVWYVIAERPGFSNLFRTTGTLAVPFAIGVLTGFCIIWAGYRFSFGHVAFTSVRLPAPELFSGVQEVINHNRRGDSSYLLGQHNNSGWWYYYLVGLAVKTPLPFLGLLLYGVIAKKPTNMRWGIYLAMAFSLAILIFSSLWSHINLGIRHILPVYSGFSIVAGFGAARLLESSRKFRVYGWVLGILLSCLAATSLLAHPDYLPYFNVLADGEPEAILVDSDLDWGQDMKRLARRLRELGAQEVSFTPFVWTDPVSEGFPPIRPTDPAQPSPGWNAASLTVLKSARFGFWGNHPEVKLWMDQIAPTEKVGKGIWLWYFPPPAASR